MLKLISQAFRQSTCLSLAISVNVCVQAAISTIGVCRGKSDVLAAAAIAFTLLFLSTQIKIPVTTPLRQVIRFRPYSGFTIVGSRCVGRTVERLDAASCFVYTLAAIYSCP